MAALEGSLEEGASLFESGRDLFEELNDEVGTWIAKQNIAWTLWKLGRVEKANQQMRALLPQVARQAEPTQVMAFAEDYAGVLSALGAHTWATRLLAAAEAMHERNNVAVFSEQAVDVAQSLTATQAAMTPEEWNREHQLGSNMTVEDALSEALAATATW